MICGPHPVHAGTIKYAWGLNSGLRYCKAVPHKAGTQSSTCATPPVHFALVILEIGSREIFAQSGLEL
jgi:hypothetical protein